MVSIEKSIDITNVIPKGVEFSIGKEKYTLIYNFSTLKRLGEIYGNVGSALEALTGDGEKYEAVVNFLYAGLHEKYSLTKQNIEEWIGTGSVNLLYNLIYSAVLLSFGKFETGDNESGEE